MSVRVQLEPAFLLSRKPYRESGALLELFTAGHGRVGVVGRGLQGAKRRRGQINPQPFAKLLVSWSGRGELVTLTAVEEAGPSPRLVGEAVFSGWYLNELLLKLLQRSDPHPALFAAYGECLADLSEAALRRFELRLLSELGYGVHWPESPDPERWYQDDGERGWRAVSAGTEDALRGSSLIALAHGMLGGEEVLRDAKRLLRARLARQLAGRSLETPRLLRSLRGQAGAKA